MNENIEKKNQNNLLNEKIISDGEKKWGEYLKSPAGQTQVKQQIKSATIDFEKGLSNADKNEIKIKALRENIESYFDMTKTKSISIELTGDEKEDVKNLLIKIGADESLKFLENGEDPKKILSSILEFADSIISNSENENTKHYVFQGIEIKNAVQKLLDYYK